jgi:hypothetical protein
VETLPAWLKSKSKRLAKMEENIEEIKAVEGSILGEDKVLRGE